MDSLDLPDRTILPMEIHIPVSHFQKNKVPQPTFPALIVAGGKLTEGLGKKRKFPCSFAHYWGGRRELDFQETSIEDTGALFATSSKKGKEEVDVDCTDLRRERQAL